MKHSSSQELFGYWNERRGDRPAPGRNEIDPAAIRRSLGDIFILATDFVDENRFRLAGTRVCALFCRELKGESFASLWDATSRDALRSLHGVVTEENTGIVAGVTGHTTDNGTVDLELLMLPLAHQGHARIRAIGVLATENAPYWLGEKPVKELELGTIRHVGSVLEQPSTKRFAVTTGNRRGFMVYQGGRITPPNESAG